MAVQGERILLAKDAYGVFFTLGESVRSSDSKLMVDMNVTGHYNGFILLSCSRVSLVSKLFFLSAFLYLHFSLKSFVLKQMNLEQHVVKNTIRKWQKKKHILKKIIYIYISELFVWMKAKFLFCEDKRDGAFSTPPVSFPQSSSSTPSSLCFSLSYSARHRCA